MFTHANKTVANVPRQTIFPADKNDASYDATGTNDPNEAPVSPCSNIEFS